ncbi:MAG: hypothetical protein QX199_06955 [Methylococcaceae bacterium]
MTNVDVLLVCALKDEYDQVLKVTDGLQTDWQEHPLDSVKFASGITARTARRLGFA